MTTQAASRRRVDALREPPETLFGLAVDGLIDAGVVVVLSLIGIAGFASSFDHTGYLVAGLGGIVLGTAVAVAAAVLRLPLVLAAPIAVAVFYLFGGALAVPSSALLGVLPSAASLSQLSIGAVDGWGDLVTLRAPVSLPEYVATVPYLCGLLTSAIGCGLALAWLPRHPRTPPRMALLLAAPLALYFTGVLLGTDQPVLAALRGVAFAGIALVWLGRRRSRRDRVFVVGAARFGRRRLAGVAVLVVGALGVGALVGTVLAPPASDRFVLREVVQPPFEPLQYPSPLSGFRDYLKNRADRTIFTVSGLRPDDRLRLAALDAYTGIIWNVAGAEVSSAGSGSFELVGRDYPQPSLFSSAGERHLEVTVGDYDDVWVPTPGYTTSLEFAGGSAGPLDDALRYNAATGTTVLTSGLHAGERFSLDAEVQRQPSDAALARVPVADVQTPPMTDVPDVVVSKALEFAGKATSPIGKLRNIQETFASQGFLSHGLASDAVPSRAGHGAGRIVELLSGSRMVGDQEQYASAFALMADSLGYPARVVMGFAPKQLGSGSGTGTVQVTGREVTAWAEVAFQGVGWVAFDPTPTRTDAPQDQTPKPQTQPQPQVRQPPRTDTDKNDLVTKTTPDNSHRRTHTGFVLPAWVVGVGLGVLIPAAIVLLPLLVVFLLKRRRWRRRRERGSGPARVAGAWDDLIDRLAELGFRPPQRVTRTVAAAALERAGPVEAASVALTAVATVVDDAVFSGREIEQAEVDAAWDEMIAAVDRVDAGLSRWRRILARYRLSSAGRALRRATAALGSVWTRAMERATARAARG